MLKKLNQKLTALGVRAKMALEELRSNEEGMEVIQVLVLLAIGLGLVALFIAFGDKITAAVSKQVDNFLKIFDK